MEFQDEKKQFYEGRGTDFLSRLDRVDDELH